jgi:predicted nucleic acid-binding protein
METIEPVCLDTDILIDYMRKPSDAVKRIMKGVLERKVSICTTSVNTFEIWLGAHLAPKQAELIEETEDFIEQLEVVNFDYESSLEAGRVMAGLRKRGQIIEIRDLFVGCICKASDQTLVTRNMKHYKRIHGLKVLTPEQTVEQLRL